MLVLTVSQLLEMTDGSVPEAFSGKIKKVGRIMPDLSKGNIDPKTKQPYTWKLQKLTITDGTNEIDVLMSKRDDVLTSAIGTKIIVVAKDGTRGKLGVKRKDNAWTNNQGKAMLTPQVEVGDYAEVTFEGGAGHTPAQQPAGRQTAPAQQNRQAPARQVAPPQQQAQQASEPDQQQQQQQETPPADQPPIITREMKDASRAAAMKEFDTRLAKAGSALNRCFDSAYAVIEQVNKRHAEKVSKQYEPHGLNLTLIPTPELVEKIAMGLMVNACWTSKPSDIDDFPAKPFQSYEKKATPGTNGNGNGNTQQDGAPFSN